MSEEGDAIWTCDDAAELYGVRNWGFNHFDISPQGDAIVNLPGKEKMVSIRLLELVSGLRERGLETPVLMRFSDILASRIAAIYEGFGRAIAQANYRGEYRGVYPIKVNQQQKVVEEVAEFGRRFHHGFETGSKAELIGAMAYMEDPDALIVCNGYKDEEFVDLALLALKMGLQTMLVVEMPGELHLILERARRIGISPRLGVRARLASRAGGRWDGSCGDRSKFGLNASQIIDLIECLRNERMLDSLQMLHYHLGSQISDIGRLRIGIGEACRFYVELAAEGAAMGYLNVGGGLAVDYDGSKTNSPSSRNYTTREYAADIVEAIMSATDQAGIPHPTIVSESGRATVAHHSVLVFDVLDVSRFEPHSIPDKLPDGSSEMLQNLMWVAGNFTGRNLQEAYHDAVYYRDELRTLFMHGYVPLRERALGETVFWHIIGRIATELRDRTRVPDEMEGLQAAIADVYYGNFSVFQSLPDSWAINQIFPVMPIHRLNERPTRLGVLADITCDSDGKIDRFIDRQETGTALPLHPVGDEDYYLGVFLVGAYQETLGDLHNLLGDTNVLHVRVGENDEIEYEQEIEGDTVAEVLSYVEYDPRDMLTRVRRSAERAVRQGRISAQERREILSAYEAGLRGYTYFEK
ncbi:MAG: biosynthetic arginine decarboxylase [Kiritimatiellae bacterium]|nr:biosynthetic arginine decarboxylase [Kiritimatiellia bacterium]